MALDRTRTLRGALAGAAAAAVWAAQQPLDRRVFGVDYDDVELLGRLVARGRAVAYPVGLALHLFNGALFGAVYANARRVAAGARRRCAGRSPGWPSTSPPGRATAALARVHPDASSRSCGARAARSRRRPGGTCCSAPCSASSSGG